MNGTIFLGGTACRKSLQEHAGRPAPSLGWPGKRKLGEANSQCNKPTYGAWGPGSQQLGAQGLGPGPPEASGPGPQKLGPPWACHQFFVVLVCLWEAGGRRQKRLLRR